MVGKKANEFAANRIAVITYNYDRSLEYFLHQSLMARYRMSESEALEILQNICIIHVHGVLGEYPVVPYKKLAEGDTLFKISEAIKIVHEIQDTPDGFCSKDFRRANTELAKAERILFLGFGFHEDNLRRLEFFSPEVFQGREVLATTGYIGKRDLGIIIERTAKYGFPEKAFHRGTCNTFFRQVAALD
jgi:hypothetical protein